MLKKSEIRALGDPGLLVNLIFPDYKIAKKQYKVGIVAHYKDKNSELLNYLRSSIKDEVLIIDIFSETYHFMNQVASCEFILSSSLHGLITADAFGIPNAWIKLSDQLHGGHFKFEDYYSVFDIDPRPVEINSISNQLIATLKDNYERVNLEKVRKSLIDSFPIHYED